MNWGCISVPINVHEHWPTSLATRISTFKHLIIFIIRINHVHFFFLFSNQSCPSSFIFTSKSYRGDNSETMLFSWQWPMPTVIWVNLLEPILLPPSIIMNVCFAPSYYQLLKHLQQCRYNTFSLLVKSQIQKFCSNRLGWDLILILNATMTLYAQKVIVTLYPNKIIFHLKYFINFMFPLSITSFVFDFINQQPHSSIPLPNNHNKKSTTTN